jgi:N-methylhydantoinase B
VLGGEHGAPMVIEVAGTKGMVGGAGVSRLRAVPLEVGDTVAVGSPGGGGYGDRQDRDQDAVADDVADGMLDGGMPDEAGPSES